MPIGHTIDYTLNEPLNNLEIIEKLGVKGLEAEGCEFIFQPTKDGKSETIGAKSGLNTFWLCEDFVRKQKLTEKLTTFASAN